MNISPPGSGGVDSCEGWIFVKIEQEDGVVEIQ
jgi:hypothetical protein